MGQKRLDVKVWSDMKGLELLISIKTITFRDYNKKYDRVGRYTKNMVRNDHELRLEASTIHHRQPYSVRSLVRPASGCTRATRLSPWGGPPR
jgi:hypothetical protein